MAIKGAEREKQPYAIAMKDGAPIVTKRTADHSDTTAFLLVSL
jgi:hypothetical protein